MDKISVRVELSKKNIFNDSYVRGDVESFKDMIKRYFAFYSNYRSTHSISARTWKFPPVYYNDVPRFKVTPNGNWDDLISIVD